GTLLWKGVRLSVENYNAIRKVVDKGIDFVICTGRGVFGVEPYLKQLDMIGKKGYVICQNGAAVYDLRNMKMVIKRSFSPAMVKPVDPELGAADVRERLASRPDWRADGNGDVATRTSFANDVRR
ncbi:MAG: HAD hydrolase family protein, partial [Thermoguttaceae bacterium]|nr:HAD hydrolase family protein [Thermoguttaceae bacterium]